MAVVNHTGNINTENWDLAVDEHHMTGTGTITNGSTVTTVNTGIIRFDGNYSLYSSGTSGRMVSSGTSTSRNRMQPNGAVTTWAVALADPQVGPATGTGSWSIQYLDMWSGPYIVDRGNNGSSFQDIAVFHGRYSGYGFYFTPSGGAKTYSNLFVTRCRGYAFYIAPTAAITITNIKATFCNGFFNAPTVAGVVTLTNARSFWCYGSTNFNSASTSTLTRLFAERHELYALVCSLNNPASSTMTECQLGSEYSGGRIAYGSGTGVCPLTDSLIMANNVTTYIIQGFASAGNDIIGNTNSTSVAVYDGTSDGDFIASYVSAVQGAPGEQVDDRALYSYWYDPDSGNTASTSTPAGYSNLDANRANPASSPNLSHTFSGVSAVVAGGNVTISGTSGILAQSRVVIRAVSGGPSVLESPWKYDGFLDPNKFTDFTLPVTAHSHVISESLLGAGLTLYAAIEGRDGVGNRFMSEEVDFSTSAAAGGGGAWVF